MGHMPSIRHYATDRPAAAAIGTAFIGIQIRHYTVTAYYISLLHTTLRYYYASVSIGYVIGYYTSLKATPRYLLFAISHCATYIHSWPEPADVRKCSNTHTESLMYLLNTQWEVYNTQCISVATCRRLHKRWPQAPLIYVGE